MQQVKHISSPLRIAHRKVESTREIGTLHPPTSISPNLGKPWECPGICPTRAELSVNFCVLRTNHTHTFHALFFDLGIIVTRKLGQHSGNRQMAPQCSIARQMMPSGSKAGQLSCRSFLKAIDDQRGPKNATQTEMKSRTTSALHCPFRHNITTTFGIMDEIISFSYTGLAIGKQ